MDVVSRFLKYVSFDTASDEDSESCPSTEKQKLLGGYLAKELEGLGLSDARMDKDGYVYANDKPGLGVDLNESEAAKYPCVNEVTTWTQTRLPDGSLQTP